MGWQFFNCQQSFSFKKKKKPTFQSCSTWKTFSPLGPLPRPVLLSVSNLRACPVPSRRQPNGAGLCSTYGNIYMELGQENPLLEFGVGPHPKAEGLVGAGRGDVVTFSQCQDVTSKIQPMRWPAVQKPHSLPASCSSEWVFLGSFCQKGTTEVHFYCSCCYQLGICSPLWQVQESF